MAEKGSHHFNINHYVELQVGVHSGSLTSNKETQELR